MNIYLDLTQYAVVKSLLQEFVDKYSKLENIGYPDIRWLNAGIEILQKMEKTQLTLDK